MRMLHWIGLCVIAIAAPASAQNLPNTMEQYIANERENWKKAYTAYGEECLPDLEAGALVPPDISIIAMNCYLRKISQYVEPEIATKEEFEALLDTWFETSMETHEGLIKPEEGEKRDTKAWYEYEEKRNKALREIYKWQK